MRKLFSILSAVLVSLATQATIVTQDIALSEFGQYGSTATVTNGVITEAGAWCGAQRWQNTDVSDYDYIVLDVADHAGNVLFKVRYSDDTEEQVKLEAGTNSAEIYLSQGTVKCIYVINFTNNTGVSITINRVYLRGAVGEREELVLWSGTHTFEDWSWDNRLSLATDKFSDVHVGDILQVFLTEDAQSYHQVQIKTQYNNKFLTFAPENMTFNGTSEDMVLRFPILEQKDLDSIAIKGGIYLNGKYLTYTKVSVIHHKVLWAGEKVIGNWEGYQIIDASKLTGLKVGNVLCVKLSALTTGGQVFLQYSDGSWHGFSEGTKRNFYFGSGVTAPTIAEIPITYKLEKQLRGNSLVVCGVNYTMTDIYVKEGTPVNTVAEYLNVTAAGMATYVLPFNVPSLPDGVEAYELTNNGDETIWANPISALEADKPVLIVAAEGEYEFVSEDGASDDITSKTGTFTNGALVGTYTTINPLAQTTGGNYNYVLNNQGGNVAFYQVRDDGCSVAPYRAYLSCGHDASNNGANFAPRMRIVFHKDAPTGVEDVQGDKLQSTKVFENGVLYIMNNGIKYNVQGQLCK